MNVGGRVRFIGIVEENTESGGIIRVFPEYCTGLRGLEAFSHIIVLYWFHLRDGDEDRSVLLVFPRRHAVKVETGVFACRSPSRPNPLGLSVVELTKVEDCTLTVKGLDALPGSPIVDIKPYLPRGDAVPNARVPEWAHRGPPT